MDSYFRDSENIFERDDLSKFGHATREESTVYGEDPQSKNLPEDNKEGYTILCVGDSYTFGGFESYENTYPYQLQKMFNSVPGNRIKVINGGACEYNSRQVLARLPSLIKDYKPDSVILLVGATNRFNLALYDMDGNSIMGIIRSFRIYKMAKMIKINFYKNFLMRWKRYSNSFHLTERATRDFGIDRYPLAQSMYNRAVEYFEKMSTIKVLPKTDDPHKIIWFYYNKGDIKKVLLLCHRILKKDYDSVILCDMAHIYHETGKIEEAKKLYESAYHNDPESEFVRFHLAYLYHRLSRREFEYDSSEFNKYQTVDIYCKAI